MSALASFRNNNGQSSPTNTSYSGISNYRTDSYKPLRDKQPIPAVPPVDARVIAKMHFDELNLFLATHMAQEPPGTRASAREKLTRLTKQQYGELATDVVDELMRRNKNTAKNEVPFLPVQDQFHPKRNQARQKLATLPKTRFKDLSSDVLFELCRRYPEFIEPETPPPNTPGSFYEDATPSPGPSPGAPGARNVYRPSNLSSQSPEETRLAYNTSPPSYRRPSQDDRRPSQDDRRPSQDTRLQSLDEGHDSQPRQVSPTGDVYSSSNLVGYRTPSPQAGPSIQRRPSSGSSYGTRRSPGADQYRPNNGLARKPTRDYPDNAYGPPPRQSSSEPQQAFGSSQGGPSTATSAVIIPNKSTIAEEEIIKVPFGAEEESPGSSRPGSVDGNRISAQSANTANWRTPGDRLSGRSPLDRLGQGQSFGLNALGAGLLSSQAKSDEDDGAASDRRANSDYYDKLSFGRASVQSDASNKVGGRGVRQSIEDIEKLRREYEFKIATMQSRMASLEGSVAAANKARDAGNARADQLDEEVRNLRDNSAKQASDVKRLQGELEDALEAKDRELRRADSDRREVARLQEQILALETDQQSAGQNAANEESLRDEVQGLLDALRESSNRNEELLTDKDADMLLIQTLNTQVKDYKKKYEQAKTELRNNKATSQLFSAPQAGKVDLKRMPIADNGVIADIHVTSFQGSIDTLLTVARSENPASVLTSMKAVVNAVTSVTDDVKAFELRPNRLEISEDTVRHLRERCEATLQNLVSAARNHASAFGLSPVSLMDAAASHVSATIIDLVKLLLLRRATSGERDRDVRSPSDYGFLANSYGNHKPGLQSAEGSRTRSPHARVPSSGSNPSHDDIHIHRNASSSTAVSSALGSMSPATSRNFDDITSSFGGISDDATTLAGGDNSWSELKPYLDAQSESLVYNIQSLLNSIRRGAQLAELEENLTQIVTIVSSIVAVCKDSFPPASAKRGGEILHELSENCNKLSEMQSLPEISKTTRTAMATSSFGVAKAMKELMKL